MKTAETLEVAVPGATFEIKLIRRPKNAPRPESVRWERRVRVKYADDTPEARRRRAADRAISRAAERDDFGSPYDAG